MHNGKEIEMVFVTTVGTFIGEYCPAWGSPDTYRVQNCMGLKTKREGEEEQDVIFLPYHRLIAHDLVVEISKHAVTVMFEPNKQLSETYKAHIERIKTRR